MVKMKHHDRQNRVQLEGALPCCRCWASRNLLDYDSAGSSTSKRCQPGRSCTMVGSSIDNVDFFYDGLIETHLWIRKGLATPSADNIKHDPNLNPTKSWQSLETLSPLTDRLRHSKLKTKPCNKAFAPKICVNPKPLYPTSSTAPADTFADSLTSWNWSFNFRTSGTIPTKENCTLGTLLTDKLYPGTIRTSSSRAVRLRSVIMVGFKARMKATFGEINQEQVSETKIRLSDKVTSPVPFAAEFRQLTADIDWNDAALDHNSIVD
ncbi:hypothetical protein BASA81_017608 [Batrachochytrium salamandrivorans]|nr:hypothetical protein BASA81_017608 [Batrachochytrium salamandrivorans]